MSKQTLKKIKNVDFRQKPLLLVVLDGVGIGRKDDFDAFYQAKTPTFDRINAEQKNARKIYAHGQYVGLPTMQDMGNSEVGHNALGAGRIIRQGAALVDDALADRSFFDSKSYQEILKSSKKGGTFHLLGLLSDGGVHSRIDQLEIILRESARRGIQKIRLHLLMDGRDVADRTAHLYLKQLEQIFEDLKDLNCDAKVASGGGRMFVTMDRYESDWQVVQRGYEAHVKGNGRAFLSALEAIESFRNEGEDISDQYLPAFVVQDQNGAIGKIKDGDAVLCFNFRGDRVIQISRAFEEDENFDKQVFDRAGNPDVYYAGILQYDGDLEIPQNYCVAPPQIENCSSEYLAHMQVRSLAISETHKFGHVTYFWNGNKSGKFSERLEDFIQIDSSKLGFVEAPQMKAMEIAEAVKDALESQKYDFIRVNLANGDMVGHTGNLEATIKACEFTDQALKIMLDALDAVGGRFLVTADHGNADDMVLRDKAKNAKKDVDGIFLKCTSHTLAQVPLIIGGQSLPENWSINKDNKEAGLANVTATYLNLLGFEAPDTYEKTLILRESFYD